MCNLILSKMNKIMLTKASETWNICKKGGKIKYGEMLLLGGQVWNKNSFLFVPFNKFGTYSAYTVFLYFLGPQPKSSHSSVIMQQPARLQEFEPKRVGPFEKNERSNDRLYFTSYLHLMSTCICSVLSL